MKEVKPLFLLKGHNLHPSCKIYQDICSCGDTCIGETISNVEECWQEHILLPINQNWSNILIIAKDTLSCGVFYLLLQKIRENDKT